MNFLCALSGKGTWARFGWDLGDCGIEGNRIMDQLAKETLERDTDPVENDLYADLMPLVNSYIPVLL